MSGCGALGGGDDLRGWARAGRGRAARVVGAARGAGCPAGSARGASRRTRAAAEARLAQLVPAAEPRSALAGEAGPVARDRAKAGRAARPSWPWEVPVSDRAGDGGHRPLAGALQLWPRLRRARARAGWGAGAASGGGAAAARSRDLRAPAAARLLSRLRPHGSRGAAGGCSARLLRSEAGGGNRVVDGPESSLAFGSWSS